MKYVGGFVVALLALSFLIGWTWIVISTAFNLPNGLPIQWIMVGIPAAFFVALPWLWIGKQMKDD